MLLAVVAGNLEIICFIDQADVSALRGEIDNSEWRHIAATRNVEQRAPIDQDAAANILVGIRTLAYVLDLRIEKYARSGVEGDAAAIGISTAEDFAGRRAVIVGPETAR